jgi:hypothetical protein
VNEIFLGIDGEMTGTDSHRHCLIQIGVALSEDTIFNSLIGWREFEFEPESLRVIGRTAESVSLGPAADVVDSELVSWAKRHGLAGKKIIPVGWGVSYFDRPYILTSLPRFHALLHHHSVELNAVAYALAGSCTYLGEYVDFDCWKRMAKKVAYLQVLNATGIPPKDHDAADDAVMALLAWRWMRQIFAAQDPSSNQITAFHPAHSSGRSDNKPIEATLPNLESHHINSTANG